MKLLVAYIKPEKLNSVKQALYDKEVFKMSITNALGCGEEPGYHEDYRGANIVEREKLYSGEIDHFRTEKRYLRKDGEVIWGLCTISSVFDKDGGFLYAICQMLDITEEYRLSKELSYQASHDVLTGLLNRREFESRIKQAWERARGEEGAHVLCYIDLDQFKVINDTSGSIAGDELLKFIISIIQKNIRNKDIFARLGSDHFG